MLSRKELDEMLELARSIELRCETSPGFTPKIVRLPATDLFWLVRSIRMLVQEKIK